MPALTATSALVGAIVLLGLWSGKRWGRRRKRIIDTEARSFHARRAGRSLVVNLTAPAPTTGGQIAPLNRGSTGDR